MLDESAGEGSPGIAAGRVLGVDLGDRRVGIALSDSARRVASPRAIVSYSGDEELRGTIGRLVVELEVSLVVVGLPLSMNGGQGVAAARAKAFVESLASVLPVPVEVHDERLSTVEATRAMRDSRPRRSSLRNQRVDDVAAAVFLQAFLDRHHDEWRIGT